MPESGVKLDFKFLNVVFSVCWDAGLTPVDNPNELLFSKLLDDDDEDDEIIMGWCWFSRSLRLFMLSKFLNCVLEFNELDKLKLDNDS